MLLLLCNRVGSIKFLMICTGVGRGVGPVLIPYIRVNWEIGGKDSTAGESCGVFECVRRGLVIHWRDWIAAPPSSAQLPDSPREAEG